MNNFLMLKVKMVEFSLEKKENHPLIIFGKYFTHSRMSPSPMLRNIFLPLFKRPKNPNNPNDIKNLLKSLPGYIEIIEQEKTGDGLQTSDECELQRLTWVCAWASSRIDDTQYIELDASFKATKPYCYCCVNSILNNESITIALTIGISESSNLYEETYAALERAGINTYVLNKFPVLSDMGVGLYAFCTNRALMQFICHRHIIESFGNKILRNWVRRLLNCATEDEYDKVSILISEEIKIWVSQFKDQNMIPSKIVDIQCMIDKSSNSKLYNYNKWALWIRAKYSIARCTNHSESMHHVFNMHCHLNQNLITRITIITRDIFSHFTRQSSIHGRSIKEKFNQLKNVNFLNKENKEEQINECSCGWNIYYTKLFGVRFPCLHEINNFEVCPEPPPLKLPAYEFMNDFHILKSNEIINFVDKEKRTKRRNMKIDELSASANNHIVKYASGPKTKYSKKQMWKAIWELENIYKISKMNAFDIVVEKFAEFNLNKEDCVTTKNLALFRVACWEAGKAFSKENENK